MASGPLLYTLALLIATPASLSSQYLAGPSPSVLFGARAKAPLHPALAAPDTIRTGIRPTYWKEGAIIGGVSGGLALGLLGAGLCSMSEQSSNGCVGTTMLAALLGAVIGGVPGALIGGSFPKSSENERLVEPDGTADDHRD